MRSIKILLMLIFGIFLISNISAFNPDGGWNDTTQTSIQITDGDSINFWVYILTANPPMNISVKLYNASSDLIYTFENNLNINDYSFSQTYEINQSVYGSTGSFELIISGSDQVESNSKTLSLTVNEIPTPMNNAPVITSTPVTEINETDSYTYQVTATDADGDTLTYSLTQEPGWLSINSTTGLITGTAPEVTIDNSSQVTVQVSDGTDIDNQSYTLTVRNVVVPVQDTTPPAITISYPMDGTTYTTEITTMIFDVNDSEGNLNSCWYSIDNVQTNQTIDCAQGSVGITSVNGSNTWTVYADDIYGNENSVSVTFTVDPNVPDTTPPTITILSPESREYNISDIFFEVMTDETAVVVMSLDNAQNITMNDGSGLLFNYTLTVSDGSHEVVFYATDGSENTAIVSITFSVNLPSTSKSKDKKDKKEQEVINFFAEDEEEYLNQFELQQPVIDLTKDIPPEQPSFFGEIWQSIVNFFRRLFGF